MVEVGDKIKLKDNSAPSWMYSLTMFLNKYGDSSSDTLERTMTYATTAREAGVDREVTFKELEAIHNGLKLEQE